MPLKHNISNNVGKERSKKYEVENQSENCFWGKDRPYRTKFLYGEVKCKVDSRPPALDWRYAYRTVPEYQARLSRIARENYDLLYAIKMAHFTRGRVDCHWRETLQPCLSNYYNRVAFLKRVHNENKLIYQRLLTQRYNNLDCLYYVEAVTISFQAFFSFIDCGTGTQQYEHCCLAKSGPKVSTAASLRSEWDRNRTEIIKLAQNKFVLFPILKQEIIEDSVFRAPEGVQRPRVCFTLCVEEHSNLGEVCVELFTDVCPRTCQLFAELLAGDKTGHSYVGTRFYRKIPRLMWSGGDVTYDCGFGCYRQLGRRVPIAAENYHFSHSMPGLLSMAVTCDNEVCGIFNITFKPLPQLDRKNVVFARIVRPSHVYQKMIAIGSALSTYPAVKLQASRQRWNGEWLQGKVNTRIADYTRRSPREKMRKLHCFGGRNVLVL